ncbi:hypothetical protein WJX73_003034 [Symbiochloris irregularis]|uniref:Uncharacterized protein n=1 Tax=Symbiochloris irregularis TaxID=706552 RepID=A0AAW1P7S8_9CHLO
MERTSAAGALGPRLAGRLTAELILRSAQYMNCVSEYEIDLRGSKIGQVENLGATENQFDSIDLSDNAIIILEGFSKLPRLKTLLLSNNRVTRIGRNLEAAIPNLAVLNLANNRLKNLKDLDNLSTLPRLQNLSLVENEVAKQPNYRLYVVFRCPTLKVLDFRKVKQKEREAAARLFADGVPAQANLFEPGEGLPEAEAIPADDTEDGQAENGTAAEGDREMTLAQKTAIQAAIANAATLEEVSRLEKALATGQLPSELQGSLNSTATPMEQG